MGENIVKLTSVNSAFIITLMLLIIPGFAVAQNSLYQDYRARRVGDIITIVLAENISGQSSTKANTKSSSAGNASGKVTGSITNFLPVFGANASLDYNTNDDISNVQNQLLKGTFTARVDTIETNGDLHITGSRSTEINGEIHTLYLQGYVRPEDVSTNNSVLSYRIADAHIKYLKKGKVKDRPGFLRKKMFLLLGVILAVTAFKGKL